MKKLWIVTGVIVLVGALGVGIFLYSSKIPSVVTPHVETSVTPTPIIALATWDDPAGFSFQYPKDLTVDKNEEDNENYAHVELTSRDHPGSIIVWASDLTVKDLNAWVKKFYPSSTSIDSTLGGEPAKKILISTPSAKLVVGTISEGLLFYVDGTLTDKVYWQTVEDGIVKTFAFTPDTSSAGSGQAESVDEEEVVQ
ncbi:MAG: PsbP-related protein [Candidatus Gottesmanbacteria bacterium]|nr:PsbP-related protein [Candidatus Gottesmanbacteria bacterium]